MLADTRGVATEAGGTRAVVSYIRFGADSAAPSRMCGRELGRVGWREHAQLMILHSELDWTIADQFTV